jgi:two-component system nitrate/nitrite response regulator NarL
MAFGGPRVTLTSIEERSSGDPQPSRPRLFVLSDVRLLRDGLVAALSYQPGVILVGSSELFVTATDLAEARPDVVLLDLAKLDNLKLSLPLRQILPNVKIVAFALADTDEEIIACAEAGISGYVSRAGSVEGRPRGRQASVP